MKPFALGVLFVHGIGTQSRGETLAAFGGPFYRWLEQRCNALAASRPAGVTQGAQEKLEESDWAGTAMPSGRDPAPANSPVALHRVVLRETKIRDATDPAAPAHATLALLSVDGAERGSVEHWLLAESCWADSFSAPGFAELARWSFGVLPWIVGSHFGAQVARRARRPRRAREQTTEPSRFQIAREAWAFSGWIWRLAAAIGAFALGLLSTVVTIPMLALVLVLGLLPIPTLRNALLKVQLRLAATLGDCFVLLARPIEAAAIVGEVRRDLAWLAAKCDEVVVVAHSQGGAVAHLALRGGVPAEFRLLFTFGSGLRKLEEARELMRSQSSFALSAVLTSVALVVLLGSSLLLLAVALGRLPPNPGSVAVVALLAVASLVVLIAGILDHLRGIPLPELERWIEWLKKKDLRWRDCYATADPVPSGAVTAAAAINTREVCNRSSTLSDHTTYWRNLDEFVSVLYDEIAGARTKDPLPELRVEPSRLERIGRRRRWRMAIGRAIDWAALAGVGAVLLRRWPETANFGAWAWSQTGSWLTGTLFAIPRGEVIEYSPGWPTIGLLLLVAVVFAIVRTLWARWDEDDMNRSLVSHENARGIGVLTGLWWLLILATQIQADDLSRSFVWTVLCFVPVMFFIVTSPAVREPAPKATSGDVPKAASKPIAAQAAVGTLLSMATALAMVAALPFFFGLSGWAAIVWLTDLLFAGSIGGFRPASVSTELAGAVAVGCAAFAWLMARLVRGRDRGIQPAEAAPVDPAVSTPTEEERLSR